jgi:hypothetical protein
MFLTAKGAKSVRKGRKAYIYRRNFAFFAVYLFLMTVDIKAMGFPAD